MTNEVEYKIVRHLLDYKHETIAIVRESIVYAMEDFIDDDVIKKMLQTVRDSDPSPGVRKAAAEALES